MTQADVNRLLDKIERLLAAANGAAQSLRVARGMERVEDEWLYAVVTGAIPGQGAAQHSKLLSDIETRIRDEDHANVLLVPAMNSD